MQKFSSRSKIVELEEELRVVGNNLKSLEVSEEKVRTQNHSMSFIKIKPKIHNLVFFFFWRTQFSVIWITKKIALMQSEGGHAFVYTNASFATVSEERNRVLVYNFQFTIFIK